MREIGGYIELDTYRGPMLHEGAIALNCGRNALAYLIETKHISQIALPYFLCSSVRNVCLAYGVRVRYYRISESFLPERMESERDEWVYVVNYYGQLTTEQLQNLAATYPQMIVDQAQAYFAPPVPSVDNIYTCRKFFGVPDGAFLYTDTILERKLPLDESFERMHYLMGRFERSASEFYQEYSEMERRLGTEPIKRMSRLTENLLHGIDYADVERRRTENYEFLSEKLDARNELKLRKVNGAFAYPFLSPNGAEVRKRLIEKKIYIPILWPNVLENIESDTLEYYYAQNILPLPCDQRYNMSAMKIILRELAL